MSLPATPSTYPSMFCLCGFDYHGYFIQYLSFCDWLISLNTMVFRVHPCCNVSEFSSFLRLKNIPLCGTHMFIYSPFNRLWVVLTFWFWSVMLLKWMKVLFAQSCLTPGDPMDCSPQGSSVHRILQARVLEWVAMPSFRGSSWPRDRNCVSFFSSLASGFFTASATWEAYIYIFIYLTVLSLEASLVAQVVSLPAMCKTRVQSLGWEDPLEKEMATHSSILPGKSHGWRSLVGYSPRGCKESDMNEQQTPPLHQVLLWDVGSNSLTRDWTWSPLHWQCSLRHRPPAKSLIQVYFFLCMILYQFPIFFQSNDRKAQAHYQKSVYFATEQESFFHFFLVSTLSFIQEPWESSHPDQPGCLVHVEFNTLLGKECAGPRNDGEEAEGRGRIWWGSKEICGELWETESEAPRERPLSLLLMFESGLRVSKNEDFKSSITWKRANWVHKEHIKIRYNPLPHKSTV